MAIPLAILGNNAVNNVDSLSTASRVSLPILARGLTFPCDYSEKSDWFGKESAMIPFFVLLFYNQPYSYK